MNLIMEVEHTKTHGCYVEESTIRWRSMTTVSQADEVCEAVEAADADGGILPTVNDIESLECRIEECQQETTRSEERVYELESDLEDAKSEIGDLEAERDELLEEVAKLKAKLMELGVAA